MIGHRSLCAWGDSGRRHFLPFHLPVKLLILWFKVQTQARKGVLTWPICARALLAPLAASLPGSCSAPSQRRFVLLVCEWFKCLPSCSSPSACSPACFKCFPSPGVWLFFSASSDGACVVLPSLPGFLFSALSPLRHLDPGQFLLSD